MLVPPYRPSAVPLVTVYKASNAGQVCIRFNPVLCKCAGLDQSGFVSIYNDEVLHELRFWVEPLGFYRGPLSEGMDIPAFKLREEKPGGSNSRLIYLHFKSVSFLPVGKYEPRFEGNFFVIKYR